MKILVIEDSNHLRRSLIVGLSNLGFTVEATGDGREGLNLTEISQISDVTREK